VLVNKNDKSKYSWKEEATKKNRAKKNNIVVSKDGESKGMNRKTYQMTQF